MRKHEHRDHRETRSRIGRDFSPEQFDDGLDSATEERWYQEEFFELEATPQKATRRRIEDWWEMHDLDEDLHAHRDHRRGTPKRIRKYAARRPH